MTTGVEKLEVVNRITTQGEDRAGINYELVNVCLTLWRSGEFDREEIRGYFEKLIGCGFEKDEAWPTWYHITQLARQFSVSRWDEID